MKMKKWIAAAMLPVLLWATTACGSKEPVESVQTLAPIETAPQQSYSTEDVAKLYNDAYDFVVNADSYHMFGNENSTSAIGDIITSVVTSVDCSYQKVNEKPLYLFNSQRSLDGRQEPRTTYIEDGIYYYDATVSTYRVKYFVTTNDQMDFSATDYLVSVNAADLQEVESRDELDGSLQVSFSVPFSKFQSNAVEKLLGGFGDEEHQDALIHVQVTLDAERKLSQFYISFDTGLAFGDAATQTIIVSMTMDGYNATTVTAPSDLSEYEDWSVEESGSMEGGVGILPEEDVD